MYSKCLKSETLESGSMYGQFVVNGLKSGHGISIGNLLRRVLLDDLGGTAITAIRIAGVRDEFSLITGVREDILEILLNLKGIVFTNSTKDMSFGRLKIKGPAVVTANSIELPSNINVINPNHYIATISDSSFLEMEVKFEHGFGYRLATQTFCEESDDFLEVDAIFLPIEKVDFKVEDIYDEQDSKKVITQRLFLDIWTNGSISAENALDAAVESALELLNSVLKNKFPKELEMSDNNNSLATINPHINIAIEELQLSVRAYNCLKRAQIHTIGDLLEYSPEKLQELKNFGRKSADEVFTTLKNKLGIILK
jgi:DNA-directed RNA polymerase subunit alpha